MTKYEKIIADITASPTEELAFQVVLNALHEFMAAFDKNAVLMNPTTGEVMELSELPRVAGILDFIQNTKTVEIL